LYGLGAECSVQSRGRASREAVGNEWQSGSGLCERAGLGIHMVSLRLRRRKEGEEKGIVMIKVITMGANNG